MNESEDQARHQALAQRSNADIHTVVDELTPAPTDASPTSAVATRTVASVRGKFRSSRGVLTDPQSLAEYNQAVPGSGEKILQCFFENVDREQSHRHDLESQALTAEIASDNTLLVQGTRAQWFGLCVVLVGLGLAGYALYLGYSYAAIAIVGTVLASAAASFIYGRKKQVELAVSASPDKLPKLESSTSDAV